MTAEEKRKTYKVLVGKLKRKRQFGRTRTRCKIILKFHYHNIGSLFFKKSATKYCYQEFWKTNLLMFIKT
jgi:hypothetical protein